MAEKSEGPFDSLEGEKTPFSIPRFLIDTVAHFIEHKLRIKIPENTFGRWGGNLPKGSGPPLEYSFSLRRGSSAPFADRPRDVVFQWLNAQFQSGALPAKGAAKIKRGDVSDLGRLNVLQTAKNLLADENLTFKEEPGESTVRTWIGEWREVVREGT
jgi:hypothetical protein